MTGQMRKLKRTAKELDEFYQEVIDEHLKNRRMEGCQEDIVDVLLRLWGEGKQLTMDQIKGALMVCMSSSVFSPFVSLFCFFSHHFTSLNRHGPFS